MKKTCRLIGSYILLIALILCFTGCTKRTESKEIIIGVAWPFETNNDLFNEGIDMAVNEINDNGGINGQELKLLKADDYSEVTKGITVAESFAKNESVRAVIGHRNSYVSLPASGIYEEAELVMLSPSSTAPELTRNHHQYTFRILPSDDEIAQKLAEHLSDQGLKRIVVYYSKDSYGTGLANSFEDQARLFGITVVDRFNYYSGTEELKRLNNKWQAFGYDGIFIATSMPEGGQFIYDAYQSGIRVPYAAGNALDSSELATIGGAMAEGIVIGSVFDPNDDSQEVEGFVQNFTKLYGQAPTNHSALGYDAVRIVAAALENTNKSDRALVANELRNLEKWTGACGVHKFSETGDDMGDLVVLKQLQEGALVSLD